MRSKYLRQAAFGSLLLAALTAVHTSSAQAATQDVGEAPAGTRDDDGFDKGLLGLAGLAGLLGLRRREEKHVHSSSDANRTATSRV